MAAPNPKILSVRAPNKSLVRNGVRFSTSNAMHTANIKFEIGQPEYVPRSGCPTFEADRNYGLLTIVHPSGTVNAHLHKVGYGHQKSNGSSSPAPG
jgi:hypothetical protein